MAKSILYAICEDNLRKSVETSSSYDEVFEKLNIKKHHKRQKLLEKLCVGLNIKLNAVNKRFFTAKRAVNYILCFLFCSICISGVIIAAKYDPYYQFDFLVFNNETIVYKNYRMMINDKDLGLRGMYTPPPIQVNNGQRVTFYYNFQDKWGQKCAMPKNLQKQAGIDGSQHHLTVAAHPDYAFGTLIRLPQFSDKFLLVADRGSAVTSKKAAAGKAYVWDIYYHAQNPSEGKKKMYGYYAKKYPMWQSVEIYGNIFENQELMSLWLAQRKKP